MPFIHVYTSFFHIVFLSHFFISVGIPIAVTYLTNQLLKKNVLGEELKWVG